METVGLSGGLRNLSLGMSTIAEPGKNMGMGIKESVRPLRKNEINTMVPNEAMYHTIQSFPGQD